MRALVVDDSRATRAILRRILGELGYEVIEAADGRQALDQLTAATDPLQLALVDWNMPIMDGLEFIRAVRADHTYDDLILLMVTTEGDTDRLVTALEAGANEYAMKPFTASVIREKLELLGVPAGGA
ncbi:response regulator [Nitriliruptoraceae bacterium ZYF776]|nr:response regulator [Profundirhabdus halotolerans]